MSKNQKRKALEDRYLNIVRFDRMGIHRSQMTKFGIENVTIEEFTSAYSWYENKMKRKYNPDYLTINIIGTYIPNGFIMFPEIKTQYSPHSFLTMTQWSEEVETVKNTPKPFMSSFKEMEEGINYVVNQPSNEFING